MLTEVEIRAALKDCFDPDLRLNIVDLGLVLGIHLQQDHDAPGAGIPGVPTRFRVTIDLTLTAQDNPSEPHILAQIQNRLAGIFEVSNTHIHLQWEPAWTPQNITPEGRRKLGLDSPDRLVQITGPSI